MQISKPSKPPAQGDWAAIERDYLAGSMTVSELCAVHGIDRNALYRRIREEGWRKRSETSARATAAKVTPAAKSRRPSPGLAERLSTLLDRKMTEFENRMADGSATSADTERDARTLNTLVRLLEKLTSPLASNKKRAGATTDAALTSKAEDDADRIRSDLAQRLERLRGQIGG
ncbi:MAG: hypothetical protein HC850_08815 [Rhodomicrobium sp.]|nr:hypothetical protein [Rhodomicrobium sp.]